MKKAKAEFHHKKDGPSGKTNFTYKNEKILVQKNDGFEKQHIQAQFQEN